MRHLPLIACIGLCSIANASDRLPVIDMHLHALPADEEGPPPMAMCTPMKLPAWDPGRPFGAVFMEMVKQPTCDDPVWLPMTDEEVRLQTMDAMERRNIYGVLSGTPDRVAEWMAKAPGRFYPGIGFQIGGDREYPVGALRNLHGEGRLAVFAEIVNQYVGIAPDDERMDPYWALAEELDIPVGIHIGTGPPGVIVHTQPRPAFYRFLQGITDAGYGNRVMFGSDQMVWPGTIERGIKVIEKAPFLSDVEKRDILYNNAARFLRLTDEEIARHHGR